MNVRSPLDMIKNRLNRDRVYCTPEYWDAKATELDGDAASAWPNNNLNTLYYARMAEAYTRLIPDFQGKKVLEIGCGTGRNTRFLLSLGAQVVGVDFSDKAIEFARKRTESDQATFRKQSLFELDDVHQYDLVVSSGTITVACRNSEELADLLARLAKALKPGGRILLLEPIHKGFLHRVLNVDQQEFVSVMKRVGFRIDHVEHMHFWPARLALAFLPWPMAVTSPAYKAGESLMETLFRNHAGGDYRIIVASTAP
ncbi:MAG: class I SAM-dependent methyltransferase [Deltaproteobacteria bacterium]|nr:class I SAM-dependent methyltransferase [Deltaproteobacteria bacterium]